MTSFHDLMDCIDRMQDYDFMMKELNTITFDFEEEHVLIKRGYAKKVDKKRKAVEDEVQQEDAKVVEQ